jgi:hypothetical protein
MRSGKLDEELQRVSAIIDHVRAHSLCSLKMSDALFLRAERLADGRRTFRIEEGDPLPTSYGQDLYRSICGIGAGETKDGPGSKAPILASG